MWCPECEEEMDRKAVVDNDFKCPQCEHDLKEVNESSEEDLDDLMTIDFVADGELDGAF